MVEKVKYQKEIHGGKLKTKSRSIASLTAVFIRIILIICSIIYNMLQ